MRNSIVADGAIRLRQSSEHRARLRELREAIRARHVKELAAPGFFRRLMLHWQMDKEFKRERMKLEPSEQSLYSSRIRSGEM